MEEEMRFGRLSTFLFGKAVLIICYFINVKVLKNVSFESFLNNFKHEIFHQWIPHLPCCKCPNQYGSSIRTRALTEPQMATMYDFHKTGNPGCESKNKRGQIIKHCICELKALTGVEIHAVDIGTLYILLRTCDKIVFERIEQQMEVIRKIRNEISHSTSRKLNEYDFNEKWKDLETAVLTIANNIDPLYKNHEAKQIAELKIADVTQEKLNLLLKVIDENKKQLEIILNMQKEEKAHETKPREHNIEIGKLSIKIKVYTCDHSPSKTIEQPSGTWKCCFCLPVIGSRYLENENISEEVKSSPVKLVKWALHPPDNWNVEKIQDKFKSNSSALTYFDEESRDTRTLIFGKEFPRPVVEDDKQFKSETESVFTKTFKDCGIDVNIKAKISVDCLVKNKEDQYAGDFSEKFHLKHTFQVHMEKAANHPNPNLVDIKSFKDGRIVIADKNMHLLKLVLFDEKEQDVRDIPLDGGPTSLDIIDDSTVCVTLPQERIVTIIDVNSEVKRSQINVEGECCSIIYKRQLFFVGFENTTLTVYSFSGEKKRVLKLFFEPSGMCGKILDDRLFFCIFYQSTKENKIYRINIDLEDLEGTDVSSNSCHEYVTLKQTVGTVHFGLSLDDDGNLLYLDKTKVYKAYTDAPSTLVLSPTKEISCMHYDMSSSTILLVTVGGEIMLYQKTKISTRL